jgi:hypothetical protein
MLRRRVVLVLQTSYGVDFVCCSASVQRSVRIVYFTVVLYVAAFLSGMKACSSGTASITHCTLVPLQPRLLTLHPLQTLRSLPACLPTIRPAAAQTVSKIGLAQPGKIMRGVTADSCERHLHQLHVCAPSKKGHTRLLYRMSMDFLDWIRYVPGIDNAWKSVAGQVRHAGGRP